MGGSRFSRKEYSEEEIQILFEKYILLENKLQSLFSSKILNSKKTWIYDLARNMSRLSKGDLQHKINIYENNVPQCSFCGNFLTRIEHLEHKNSYTKYCSSCTHIKVWATKDAINPDVLKKRAHTISKIKSEWYKTDQGKLFAEKIGKINSVRMKEFNKTDAGKQNIEKSREYNRKLMLEKIATGKFTPPITNRRTHWNAEIIINDKIKKFRSSWEACVFLSNPEWKYESVRIPYKSVDGTTRTYIADFYDTDSNTLYEIKPTSEWLSADNKMQQIIRYCIAENINFIWLNEHNIMNYIDDNLFHGTNIKQLEKLKKGILYEKNLNKKNK